MVGMQSSSCPPPTLQAEQNNTQKYKCQLQYRYIPESGCCNHKLNSDQWYKARALAEQTAPHYKPCLAYASLTMWMFYMPVIMSHPLKASPPAPGKLHMLLMPLLPLPLPY